MTRARALELLPVIQAFAEGKVIQWRCGGGENIWIDYQELCDQGFEKGGEYRIKPEPRERFIVLNLSSRSEFLYYTETQAKEHGAMSSYDIEIIHVREVLP